MNMNFITYLVMYSFPLVSIAVFKRFPPRTAIIAVFVGGFILLPQAILSLPHIPYQKLHALSIGLMVGILSVDSKRILSFKPSAIDLPMLCWCVAPLFTSLTNNLGLYDGLNGIEYKILIYGIPYTVGRIYFNTETGIRDLAMGVVLGGLFLAPFVLVEIKMSPQFHTWVYGFYPHDFSETKRAGGFRPSVFMSHGLELAIWNASACFLGWQMYSRRILPPKIPVLNTPWIAPLIVMTLGFVGSRSGGATILCIISLGLCWICSHFRMKWPILIFGILPILYPLLRGSQLWTGENLLRASISIAGPDRARSLAYRMLNENLLSQKASIKGVFGWGPYQRSFVRDSSGRIISTPDGKWILVYGENGALGLASFWLVLFLSPTLYLLKRSPSDLFVNQALPATLFAIWCYTTLADDCFNDMNNPVMLMAAGGLSTLAGLPINRETTEGKTAVQDRCAAPSLRII